MPYKFTFDISKKKYHFFTEILIVGYQKGISKVFFKNLQGIIRKLRLQEATGFNLEDNIMIIQDLVDMNYLNLVQRKKFLQTKNRALFLPHCSRKYMDNRCKAIFDASCPLTFVLIVHLTVVSTKQTMLPKKKDTTFMSCLVALVFQKF